MVRHGQLYQYFFVKKKVKKGEFTEISKIVKKENVEKRLK